MFGDICNKSHLAIGKSILFLFYYTASFSNGEASCSRYQISPLIELPPS